MKIRQVELADAAAIARIYNPYVLDTTITFEVEAVSADEMRRRIAEIQGKYPYIVCEEDGNVVGYCYAHPWRMRAAFCHTAEVSIYVDSACRGNGLGKALLEELIQRCKAQGLHVLIAGITEGNEHSRHLHENFGFRKVAQYDEVGYKFGRWLELSQYELLL